MNENILGQTVEVVKTTNLYKWAKTWGKIQKNYYQDRVYLRREKQLEDFVHLNEFTHPYVVKDTDILTNIQSVDTPNNADLVIITDQKFSRQPCSGIVEKIVELLNQCPHLLLCLNRHYINIDNQFIDIELDQNLNLAITQWLKKNLPGDVVVVDMSLDYLDCGDYFTWVIPDRIYYIKK
jgi:hypothetical protein